LKGSSLINDLTPKNRDNMNLVLETEISILILDDKKKVSALLVLPLLEGVSHLSSGTYTNFIQ